MKRLSTLLFALLICVVLFAANAYADDSGTCGANLTWTYASATGTLTISGSGAMTDYSSTDTAPWNSYSESIRTVTIADGVATIGSYAFADCNGLTGVCIPDSVTAVNAFAFDSCRGLKEVHISRIDKWLEIRFKNYNANPLYYAHTLYVGEQKITELVIPEGVQAIGSYAFDGCSTLTSVTIPNTVTHIGMQAFAECSGLTGVTIPDSVTAIDSGVFYYCSGLTSIRLPARLRIISDLTFSNCSSLTSVTIPDSVTYIAAYAFRDCSELTDVYYGGTESAAKTINTTYGNEALADAVWHYNSVMLFTLHIPASTTVIQAEAFAGTAAERIVVPASVEEIGSRAFANSPGLQVLRIEGSPRIAADILSGCTNVTVQVYPGTAAAAWAAQRGFSVEYIDF